MSDLHASSREKDQRSAEKAVRRAGYRDGGRVHSDVKDEKEEDAKSDKALVAKGVHQHEAHDHKGEPKTQLRLRRGGHVEGVAAHSRLDRRARGGALGGHKKGGLNIIIKNQPMHPAEKQMAAQQGAQQGMRIGAALGARQAAARMGGAGAASPPAPGAAGPGRLPIAGPGGGGPPGMPPVGAPPPRPGMMSKGGEVRVKEHYRRKAGGRV